jgi:sugar phosphate isomerase/epimerase
LEELSMKTNRRELFFTSLAAAPTLAASGNGSKDELSPCINEVTTLEASFEHDLEAYASAGFRHVELWLPKLDKLGLKAPAIASALRHAGLKVASACASDAGFATPENKLANQIDELKRNLETAQALGSPRYVVYSGAGASKPQDYKAASALLARYADVAEAYDVRIAFEFIAGARLAGSFRTALEMVRAADHPNLGVCVDTFHLYAGISKVEDLLLSKPGEIAHVHFHDAPAALPRELWRDSDRLPPGEGCMPMHDIVKALKRVGYRGALSVELFGGSYQSGDPREVAARCYSAVRKFC